MVADPSPFMAISLLSMDPSPVVLRSAANAASTPHGLVNLRRLVHSLDKLGLQDSDNDFDPLEWVDVQNIWETVLYARALLNALNSANSMSSTTASDLSSLDFILSNVEAQVQARAKRTRAPAPPTSLPFIELPNIIAATEANGPSSPIALLEENVTASFDDTEADIATDLPSPSLPLPPRTVPSPVAVQSPGSNLGTSASSPVFDVDTYFAKRAKEDANGGEAGLLPIKLQGSKLKDEAMDQEGMRNRLLKGASATIGASQLHEELGAGLVDMSRQFKLNALHLSSSLAEEKPLMEQAQDALEKNLDKTLASKGQLSTVSRKGRGTTCMSLGIVVLVIVLFIWTYMLIRFT